MTAGMTWPIQVGQTNVLPSLGVDLYLADNCTSKTDNHSPADDLTLHHKVPAFVEHLEELAGV
jgi:hypothetical protein